MRDINLGDTIYPKFTTRAFATGIPTTLAGTPVLSVYEENNLTQITSGVSVTVDYDSVTGLNQATIVATGGNGYEAGKSYDLVITTGTVSSVSVVGEVVFSFTVEDTTALMPTTAGRKLDVTATGAAGIDWGNVENQSTAVDLSGTDIQLVDTATALTNGATLANGAITDASLAGNMEIVFETDFATNYNTTDNAWVTNGTSFIGTGWNVDKTGYSLSATGLDAITEAATGMVEIAKAVWNRVLSGATHNITNSAGRRLRQIDASFVIDTGTAQAGAAGTITLAATAPSTDDILNGDRVVIVGGTGAGEHGLIIDYNGTTKVATMSKNWVVTPDNTSEYDIAPADCDIETWNNVAVTGDGDWSEMQTDVDTILVDTNELQTDWTNGGRLDLIIDAIQTEVLKLTTTAHTEPTGVPAANEAPIDKIGYLFMALRNQVDVTATKKTFYDDGGTAEWEKDLSDDGTTYSETEGNAI